MSMSLSAAAENVANRTISSPSARPFRTIGMPLSPRRSISVSIASDLVPTSGSSICAVRTGKNFRGTERYTIIRALGAGGMGIVYEVHDRVRNENVALKTLLRASAGASATRRRALGIAR
jgi:hypothetical protein